VKTTGTAAATILKRVVDGHGSSCLIALRISKVTALYGLGFPSSRRDRSEDCSTSMEPEKTDLILCTEPPKRVSSLLRVRIEA
jgi:hypothetical protein